MTLIKHMRVRHRRIPGKTGRLESVCPWSPNPHASVLWDGARHVTSAGMDKIEADPAYEEHNRKCLERAGMVEGKGNNY